MTYNRQAIEIRDFAHLIQVVRRLKFYGYVRLDHTNTYEFRTTNSVYVRDLWL